MTQAAVQLSRCHSSVGQGSEGQPLGQLPGHCRMISGAGSGGRVEPELSDRDAARPPPQTLGLPTHSG